MKAASLAGLIFLSASAGLAFAATGPIGNGGRPIAPTPTPTQPVNVVSGHLIVDSLTTGTVTVSTAGGAIFSAAHPGTVQGTLGVTGAFPTPLATVTVVQGTSPWVISGAPTPLATVTVVQGTSPWVISGAPTPLATVTVVVSGTPNVNVVNTPTVNAGTGFPTPLATVTVVVSGTPTVNAGTGFPTPYPTQAISATSLPLPANAAQETGGNLASLVTSQVPLSQDAPMGSTTMALIVHEPLTPPAVNNLIPRCNNVRKINCR